MKTCIISCKPTYVLSIPVVQPIFPSFFISLFKNVGGFITGEVLINSEVCIVLLSNMVVQNI